MDHVQSLKEVARHLIHRAGGMRLLKRVRGLRHHHLEGASAEERFATIYRDRIWGSEALSLSGPGSSMRATAHLPGALSELLAELGATQVTDIGCGDFRWMQRVEGTFSYTGVDIVESVIDELNRRYATPERRFLRLNAARDELPEGDVAVCRDVLFHLSFRDARSVLENIKRNGYRYLIATSDGETWFNADIESGDHRPLNLRRAPFSLPAPVRTLRDDRKKRGRILGVWPTAVLS